MECLLARNTFDIIIFCLAVNCEDITISSDLGSLIQDSPTALEGLRDLLIIVPSIFQQFGTLKVLLTKELY